MMQPIHVLRLVLLIWILITIEAASRAAIGAVGAHAAIGAINAVGSIGAVGVNEMFPWLPHASLHAPAERRNADDMDQADEFDYVEEEVPEAPRASFSHVLPAAGVLHIMHNAAADMLTTSMKKVEAEVMRFLTNSDKRDMMLETCFDDAVGRSFHSKIKMVQGNVYKKRWGTVAFCTAQILELGILR